MVHILVTCLWDTQARFCNVHYSFNFIQNPTSLKISLHEGPHYQLAVNFAVDNTRAAR